MKPEMVNDKCPALSSLPVRSKTHPNVNLKQAEASQVPTVNLHDAKLNGSSEVNKIVNHDHKPV